MGNIHVKLYEIWTIGSGGDVLLRKVYARMDDGQRMNVGHNTSPRAFGSGELKKGAQCLKSACCFRQPPSSNSP